MLNCRMHRFSYDSLCFFLFPSPKREPFTLGTIILTGVEESPLKSILPRPEDFSKALLYIIDMGQNDLANSTFYFPTNATLLLQNARSVTIPKMISEISKIDICE